MDAFGGVYRLVKQVIVKVQLYVKAHYRLFVQHCCLLLLRSEQPIPVEVPALTLNNLCGSGLKCINLAAAMIQAGEADIIVAGGMESMSGAAYAVPKGRYGYRMGDGQFIDTMIKDGLTDAFNHYHMGITAENVAEQYDVTREDQDDFAAKSQQKCEAAQAAGRFDDEIVPVPVK